MAGVSGGGKAAEGGMERAHRLPREGGRAALGESGMQGASVTSQGRILDPRHGNLTQGPQLRAGERAVGQSG